jgi:hypothetical protein
MGTIYKAVYDDRTPISRDTLKITIPLKLWDDKKQKVRPNMEIDHEKYNYILNQHKSDFLGANKKAVRTNRDCFIEFATDYLEKNYTNEGTKVKYTTVLNSLKKYVNEELKLRSCGKLTLLRGTRNGYSRDNTQVEMKRSLREPKRFSIT